MKRPPGHSAARGTTNNDRHRSVPEVMRFRHEVRNLIEAAGDEINELHFAHRTQAEKTHTASRADNRRFGDGCLNNSLAAKFRQHAVGYLKCSAVHPDIFTDGDDGG